MALVGSNGAGKVRYYAPSPASSGHELGRSVSPGRRSGDLLPSGLRGSACCTFPRMLRLSEPVDRGQSAARCLSPAGPGRPPHHSARCRRLLRTLPPVGRTAAQPGGPAVGRRTTDPCSGARADWGTQVADARRAKPRVGTRDHRAIAGIAPGGVSLRHDHPASRATCACCLVDRRPRLRAVTRPRRAVGTRRRVGERSWRATRLSRLSRCGIIMPLVCVSGYPGRGARFWPRPSCCWAVAS